MKYFLIKKTVRHQNVARITNIMKICILSLFVGVTQAFGTNTYSRNVTINLRMNNATVEEIINDIEEQSEFRFLYNKKIVNVESKASILAENENITSVLDNLFRDTDISYAISDRQIVLNKKGVFLNLQPVTSQAKRITGTIIDANDEPVIGANVIEKGTTNGTVTDVNGAFSLSVPNNAVLQVSFIGYITQEVDISAMGGVIH